MLYITGPRAGARQSRQCKDKRKYESASVQVQHIIHETHDFLLIMKLQLILLPTREHSVYTVYR